MILKLDLLQNSIDYFENSLEAYIEADENGEYGNYADINKKKRWKVAVVFICQALELIFKYKLQTINEVLVFDNIDANITSGYFKTIDASKTIVRLKNLKELNLSEEEGEFVQNCFKIRNRFIHYNVEIDYEKIKSQYAKLVAIYEKIHNQYTGKDSFQFEVNKRDLFNKAITELKEFDERYVIFRGVQVEKECALGLQREIGFNQKYSLLRDTEGDEFQRIRYMTTNADEDRYCGDCCAIFGEFHLFGCDIEICPKCGKQLISCECGMKLIVKDNAWTTEDYYRLYHYDFD